MFFVSDKNWTIQTINIIITIKNYNKKHELNSTNPKRKITNIEKFT
jgi:hypothetical protein